MSFGGKETDLPFAAQKMPICGPYIDLLRELEAQNEGRKSTHKTYN